MSETHHVVPEDHPADYDLVLDGGETVRIKPRRFLEGYCCVCDRTFGPDEEAAYDEHMSGCPCAPVDPET